jgi:hypothetical protein
VGLLPLSVKISALPAILTGKNSGIVLQLQRKLKGINRMILKNLDLITVNCRLGFL